MSAPRSSDDPFRELGVRRVVNAAGKMTALGGTAQSERVAQAQASAARRHVDIAELRLAAGRRIAELTGAEAASVTSGAAAGIAIGIAALITGRDLEKVHQIPDTSGLANRVLIQSGHDVNFGAPVLQMIRLGGGRPEVVGNRSLVASGELDQALRSAPKPVGLLYVQSHHCVQDQRVPLADCIARARAAGVPVFVDAAAEEDLREYIAAGVDLVTYSGGKAFGGPTCGFIAGRRELVAACELQQAGIARSMKVGKEQIAGLIAALDEYVTARNDRKDQEAKILAALHRALDGLASVDVFLKDDEAGRPIRRIALRARDPSVDLAQLVHHLAVGDPSIRTRNHQLSSGIVLVDPRELSGDEVPLVAERLRNWFAKERHR